MASRARPALIAANVAATGLGFGVLQWCIFLLLQSYMASTAMVFLVASAAWLAGSLAGLALPHGRHELAWLAGSFAAYFALRAAAMAWPFQLAVLPLLLVGVALVGAYAGRFFRLRAAAFGRVKWLFVLENTSFVMGMLLAVYGLHALGSAALWALPAGSGLLVLGTWVAALPHVGPGAPHQP